MNFDTNSKITDIIMFNSRNLGALIVDERPHVSEWDEPQFGIQNIGIEESYGFGVLNEGQAIAVAKRRRNPQEREPAAGRRSPLGGLGERGLRDAERSGRRSPIDVSAERFERFQDPVRPSARGCRVLNCCRAGPGAGSEAPAERGFSSLPAPVLKPVPGAQASFTADR